MNEIVGHGKGRNFGAELLTSGLSYLETLNGPWHKQANQIFLAIVLAHWAEHIWQAVQVYLLKWPRSHSHGALGLVFPWLVTSEWLHYGYAFIMLIGLILLRPGYVGRARMWWSVALAIQVWHFFEHALLLVQAMLRTNLFDAPVPISILQLMVPRVELHLFYNAIVFIPMVVAMFYHVYPPPTERVLPVCSCHRPRAVCPSG